METIPMHPQAARSSIVGLHYLRAIATILVVTVHAVANASAPKYFGPGLLTDFFKRPAGEVDFFFIMSGFIMIATATDSTTGKPRLRFGEFLKRRALRIIPMLWFSVIFFDVAFFASHGEFDQASSLRALFFWPVGTVTPGVVWTIRHEVLFYIVFSICFLWQPRLRPFAALWFVSPFFLLIWNNGAKLDESTLQWFLFSPYNLDFGVGVGMAIILKHWKHTVDLAFQLPVLCAIALLLRVFVNWHGFEVRSLSMIVAIAPICAVAMLVAVRTAATTTSKFTTMLGDASYSIFLLHYTFVPIFLAFLSRFAPWLPSTAAALMIIIASVGLSCGAHYLIERPMRAMRWPASFNRALPKPIPAPQSSPSAAP
jgi:exopolysaccharide production protein ExoZ